MSRRLLEQRSSQGIALDATAEPVAPGPEPHELAESAFAAARVREAIAALPAGQRDAVTLFYLAGLSQAEVAEHLGTAVGAVKTRLHKARASLHERLSDLQKEPTPVPTVPMRIADVRDTGRDEILSSHVIFLEEENGPRRLPIWVGAAEATTLALRLRDVALPRPGTYELAGDLLRAAGTHLREVRIVALTESIFYAEAVLGDGTTVDARPSDALNLALVLGVPVLVDEKVLAQAADEDAATSEMLAQALSSTRDAGAIADDVSRARLAEQARPGSSGPEARLVRKRANGPSVRAPGRAEPRGADDRVEDDVGVGLGHQAYEPLGPGQHLAVGPGLGGAGRGIGIAESDPLHAVPAREVDQGVVRALGRQPDELELVPGARHHVECLQADGARGAEDQEPLHRRPMMAG